MPSIEARDISVTSAGRTVLEHVSLTVPDGETLAIVGPVGAGKSLLLKVLVGLRDPSSGDVVIDDVVVTGDDPRTRDVSMMFDDYELHPQLDVRGNLGFSSTLRRGYDKAALADRVAEVAELLSLEDVLAHRPAVLDEARRQRVAAGRALTREARAYLLDDPFSAQSERLRPHVRSVVLQWQRDHRRTTLLTTSDVDEALATADRVAVMNRGFVHQVGTPRELYDSPADMFVAGYLGAPPMNLIPGFPEGAEIQTPLGVLPLDAELQRTVGDRQVVVVGVRPEHLQQEEADGFTFTAAIDDVEWRGRSQFAYLGYAIDPAIEEVLDEVEELVAFDLFQSFVVAELPAEAELAQGQQLRLSAPARHVHVFDPVTGENLTS